MQDGIEEAAGGTPAGQGGTDSHQAATERSPDKLKSGRTIGSELPGKKRRRKSPEQQHDIHQRHAVVEPPVHLFVNSQQRTETDGVIDPVTPEPDPAKDRPHQPAHHQAEDRHNQQDSANERRPFLDKNPLVIRPEPIQPANATMHAQSLLPTQCYPAGRSTRHLSGKLYPPASRSLHGHYAPLPFKCIDVAQYAIYRDTVNFGVRRQKRA